MTNDLGQFVAPNLIPGRYRVVASLPGFKTLERQDLIVRANERLAVDLGLDVGEVTERGEVRGDLAPLLQKESSTVKSVLEADQVTELPTVNRTVFNLATLVAGANTGDPYSNDNNATIPDNGRAAQGLSINGQGTPGNTYVLDGVNNNNPSSTAAYMAILPPLEAIQEFSIETSNSAPEMARGGAALTMTLKSGTNEFHGTIFEFHRNAALDARNFFDRRTENDPRRLPNFVQNQFGFTLGGPIAKERTFFFVDYQGFRQRQGQTLTTTVPGAKVKRGDFSGTAQPIFDPATYDPATDTRQPFPGNVIPESRFNPAAKAVLRYFPLPNDPTGTILPFGQGFFFSSPSVERDQDSFDIKIDHQISERDFFTARYSYSYGRSNTMKNCFFSYYLF